MPLARFAREHGLELRFIEYMPLDAGDLWEREKVLFAAEILDLLAEGIGPLCPVERPGSRGACARLRICRRRRPGRVHRLGEPAVLHELQPAPADRRRQAAQLPFSLEETDVRGLLRGGASDAAIAAGYARLRGLEVGGARDQHGAVHQAGAADALDRGLKLA